MSYRRLMPMSAVVLLSLTFTLRFCEAAPLEEQTAQVPQFPIESYVLANGLQVALSHDPAAPRTTVCVAYHVGSKNERAGLTGFAHFFEHMMFRGTKNVPDFDVPLQQAGGSPNAFTSEDMTVYFETVSNDYVKRALYMEAERMAFLSSALDQHKFDTEREVVKNERRQRMENQPYGLADEAISTYVYPKGHPYSWSVIGSMKDLNNATLDDLRQFFLEFYHPKNATLTMVGGFDTEVAKKWIATYFGPISRGPDVQRPTAATVMATARRVIQKDRVQFPRVYWTWPAVAESASDAPALDLLAMLLADGDASKLKHALVVQSQVAVDTDAANETSEIGGLFKITATVAEGKTVEEVEALIDKTLKHVQSSGVSDSELTRVKAKYRTDMLTGLTSPTQRAFVIAMGLAQHHDPHYYQSAFTRYESVTVRDIQRVAQKYLVNDKVVLVVEPVGADEEESKAALAGPLPGEQQHEKLQPREHVSGPDWATLPDATERKPFVPSAFQQGTLSNGLEVWMATWHTLPLVSTQLLVRTGSANNAAQQAGLAALTAELWDQGTQDLTSTQLAQAVDALGTSINVSSGTNTTRLGFTTESRSFAQMVELTGGMIAAPRFANDDFDREQKLQLSDLASGPDSASWIAGRVFPTLLFGVGQPYSLPRDGYNDTVEKLSIEQVRSFYADHFTPRNSVLIVVGDFEPDHVMKLLEDKFSTWQGVAPADHAPAAKPVSVAGTVYVVDKPGAVQSVIAVGRTWKGRDDDSYLATRIGNRIFGGDFLSRVNQNLRQRNGFTYGARSVFRFYVHGSNWNLTTSVRAEVTGAALREVFNELRDVGQKRPLTDAEVNVAKSAIMSTFPQSFETPSSIASSLGQLAIYQLPHDYYQTFLDRLQSTNAAATAKAMTELVDPSQIRTLVVGDRKIIVPKLKEAGFDSIEYLDTDGR